MAFSARQVRALRRQPDHRHIRTREAHGRELTYLEGWYAISEANRIFGFDGWSRETVESRCVLARENRGTFLAIYLAHVRLKPMRPSEPWLLLASLSGLSFTGAARRRQSPCPHRRSFRCPRMPGSVFIRTTQPQFRGRPPTTAGATVHRLLNNCRKSSAMPNRQWRLHRQWRQQHLTYRRGSTKASCHSPSPSGYATRRT
jgi:hypothetical protein